MKKLLLLLVLSIGAASAVRAQIPQNIAYQGYLTQNGQPFNGSVPASFTLWDQSSGGTQAWNQQSQSVQVTNGYYTVMLNFSQNWQNPYTTFNNQYWLEVLINGNTLGRVQLAASPYAMNARIADSAIHIPQAPVGTIVAYAGSIRGLGNEAQLGWFVCDGRLIAADSFPSYNENVGTLYGSNNFGDSLALPDLRGLFLRGVNTGTASSGSYSARTDQFADPQDGRSAPASQNSTASRTGVGSVQTDAVGPHQHIMPVNGAIAGPGGAIYGEATISSSGDVNGTSGNGGATLTSLPNPAGASYSQGFPTGLASSENRPKNAYVYWLIKVR
jgi:microcystin-dependent protein